MKGKSFFLLFALTVLVAVVVGVKPALNGVAPEPGTPAMRALFAMAPTFTNFNFGSFGSPPRYVLDTQNMYRAQCEERPDRWFRGGYEAVIDKIRGQIAKYLNADDEKNVVFIENVSSAVNAVLRSFGFKRNDAILYLSTAYGMVKNTADYLRQFEGVEIVEVQLRFLGNGTAPVDLEGRDVVSAVSHALSTHANIKFAVFSHIASVPAFLLPIEELAQICKKANVVTLIDGAHAFGQADVDLTKLKAAGVSYWTGNGHKWLYSPKGSAVMWVAQEQQAKLAPTVISSAYKAPVVEEHSDLLNHFEYTGTRDYTSFASMAAALEFRQWVGEEKIRKYNHDLAVWGQDRLAEIWNTEVLLPPSLTGFMGHARFPVNSQTEMMQVATTLFNETDTIITTFPLVDPLTNVTTFWIRLSAQIFLNGEEVEEMGFRVLDIKKRLGY